MYGVGDDVGYGVGNDVGFFVGAAVGHGVTGGHIRAGVPAPPLAVDIFLAADTDGDGDSPSRLSGPASARGSQLSSEISCEPSHTEFTGHCSTIL